MAMLTLIGSYSSLICMVYLGMSQDSTLGAAFTMTGDEFSEDNDGTSRMRD